MATFGSSPRIAPDIRKPSIAFANAACDVLTALIHEYFRQICRILLTRLQIEVRLMGPLVASPNPVIFSPFAVPMANASAASFGRC